MHLALLDLLLEWLTSGCSITWTLAEILEVSSLSFCGHKFLLCNIAKKEDTIRKSHLNLSSHNYVYMSHSKSGTK